MKASNLLKTFLGGIAGVAAPAAFVLLVAAVHPAAAQSTPAPNLNGNPPPFDFNDAFYSENGIDVMHLNKKDGQRFGIFRQTGAPAGSGQMNWVVDNSNTDPDRKNVRILATTGGYQDDTGSPTQFINIIAFLTNQNFFTGVPNARGVLMQDLVSNFEAYAALKQTVNGTFQPTPCASIGDPNLVAAGKCFPVGSVATPNLRQDWRFSTNRNAIDGSAPFSYFGDNLLGMWIITYFWYTDAGFGPNQTAVCKPVMDALAAKNGVNLDGTPIIKTGLELNFMEGNQGVPSTIPGIPDSALPSTPCAAEGKLDPGGADGGAVWLICPAIPDPTQGAITQDAFLDTVRKPDGTPIDPKVTASFNCLQQTGNYCTLPNGTYTVENNVSLLVWDGSGGAAGTQVQLSGLNGTDAGAKQQWTFTSNTDGTYTIVNAVTGLALDNPVSSTASGTPLDQAAASGGANQKWNITPLNNGFLITNASSGLAVDASTDTPSGGTMIVEATATGQTAQIWVIH
jgi:hypothetical protein